MENDGQKGERLQTVTYGIIGKTVALIVGRFSRIFGGKCDRNYKKNPRFRAFATQAKKFDFLVERDILSSNI